MIVVYRMKLYTLYANVGDIILWGGFCQDKSFAQE